MPLTSLFERTKKRALVEYRSLLYYRGGVPKKPGQAAISQRVIKEEAARRFEGSGAYRKRLRYFVDGLVIGSEGFIREHIGVLREKGEYLRRQHPMPHSESPHLSLREQRATAVSF